ncbi:MAG: sensor histidine kinase [Lachnospiraceae bacterium]|nr:sensor histidine kinase [Lachnospiraceae bacterium]
MIFDNNTAYQTYRILVAIFCTLGMFATTTPMKGNPKRNLLILGGYAVYAIVVTFVSIRFLGFLSFLRSAVFTISIPGVIISYVISDTSLSRHIFNSLSQLLFSLYLIISLTLINTFLGGTLLSNAILLLLAYLIMILLEFFFVRNIFLTIAGTITKGWGILALIPCSFFLLAFVVGVYPLHYTQNPSFPLIFYILGAVILIIYYAIFQNLWTQYQYRMEEQNREILELQIQSIKNHAKDEKRKAEEVRKVWQDTHHMLSGIAMLAEAGNAEAILQFVAEASALNNATAPACYCSDPILNATLTTYLDRAKNSGITVELHLAFPQTLPVDSAELSICFANALENAIKACEKLPKNERKIIVKCIHKPTFMFEIANPYKGRITFGKNGLPQSPETGHGIGTRSIMAFCEKHNAFYAFTAEEGWFKIVVTL